MIRVATYNVHKCRGMDRRTHPERIAEVMRATNADAIACQEILAAQVDDITRELPGYSAHFGEVRKHLGEPYGNACLLPRTSLTRSSRLCTPSDGCATRTIGGPPR